MLQGRWRNANLEDFFWPRVNRMILLWDESLGDALYDRKEKKWKISLSNNFLFKATALSYQLQGRGSLCSSPKRNFRPNLFKIWNQLFLYSMIEDVYRCSFVCKFTFFYSSQFFIIYDFFRICAFSAYNIPYVIFHILMLNNFKFLETQHKPHNGQKIPKPYWNDPMILVMFFCHKSNKNTFRCLLIWWWLFPVQAYTRCNNIVLFNYANNCFHLKWAWFIMKNIGKTQGKPEQDLSSVSLGRLHLICLYPSQSST